MYIINIKNDGFEKEIHGANEKLKSGNVVKGINTIDSFSFSMLPSNAGFNSIQDFKTLVTVYNTNKKRYEFHGRVLYSNTEMDSNGLITKAATCESFMGFLCDSQQLYVEERNWTPEELLQHIIDVHNSQVEDYKKFVLGEVTVTDPNDNLYVGIQRDNSWKTIEEKLTKKLGGEVRFRVEDDIIYFDYLEKIGVTRETSIELSKNMKSISRECNPSEFITRLIPLGKKLSEDSEDRLDISSVNNGKIYIDDETGIEKYGIHVGYLTFDDVSIPSNLLTKGRDWMMENNRVQVKYSITALDLSLLGLVVDDFDVHNYHPIKNPLLGIDDTARIIKKNIDVCDEVKSAFEIGDNFKTYNDIQMDQFHSTIQSIQTIKDITNSLKNQMSSTKQEVSDLKVQIEGTKMYFYIKYSQYADGHVMTDVPNENTAYVGICATEETKAPTDHERYEWFKGVGKDGIKGESQYLHIKYSDDGVTFTDNDGETLGAWIGTLVDFNETDSLVFSDYTWKKFTEDVDEELDEIRETITDEKAYILEEIGKVITAAEATYIKEISDLETYIKTVENQFTTSSEGFSFDFEQIAGKLAELGSEISVQKQYIRLIEGTIYIGHSDSPITAEFTNDALIFKYNGFSVAKFTNEFLEVRNIAIENQIAFFDQWAIRQGAYVDGVGFNLNDLWIGG